MTNLRDSTEELSALRLQKRLYEQAARLMGVGAWECDLKTGRLSWTEGVYRLFGLSVDTSLERASIVERYVDASRETMELARAEALVGGKTFQLDAEIRIADGTTRWIRLTGDVASEGGRPIRLFGAKQDVTTERAAWSRLRQIAENDALTGLANRGVFDARYRAVVADAIDHGAVSALALIDLDRFKQINDEFGHAGGDECLRQVAMRLQRVFRHAVLVSRIGGDEFAVLLPKSMTPTLVARTLKTASVTLCRPVFWKARRIEIGMSIGVTILGRPHRRRLSDLFTEADTALYEAKAAGNNAIRTFGAVGSPVPVPAECIAESACGPLSAIA